MHKEQGASFIYLTMRLLIATPSIGPVDGGTFVRLSGHGFNARAANLGYLQCKFNYSITPALFVSMFEAACYSPEMPAGTVNLQLSNNHQDFTSENIFFSYNHMHVNSIWPTQGPTRGGSKLHILGNKVSHSNVSNIQQKLVDLLSCAHLSVYINLFSGRGTLGF